jgi:hypothetical protein
VNTLRLTVSDAGESISSAPQTITVTDTTIGLLTQAMASFGVSDFGSPGAGFVPPPNSSMTNLAPPGPTSPRLSDHG